MRQFQDNANRKWEVVINVGTVRRVRDLLQVDLPGLFEREMEPLLELLRDPVRIVEVVWGLIEKQAGGAQVTPEMFGEAMGGDALQGASDALVDGLVDFFPRQKAASLRRLLGEARKAQAEIEKRLMK